MGCVWQIEGEIHKYVCNGTAIQWKVGDSTLRHPVETTNPYVLPFTPYQTNGDWWFPIRPLAEALGFNTRYDPATGRVSVVRLRESANHATLELDSVVSGTDLSFSYFIMAHETPDHLYIVYDHSYDIIRFNKANFTYTRLSGDARYGFLREFAVSPAGVLYAATQNGFLLRWNGIQFDRLVGGGTVELTAVGQATSFANVTLDSLNQIVIDRAVAFCMRSTDPHIACTDSICRPSRFNWLWRVPF